MAKLKFTQTQWELLQNYMALNIQIMNKAIIIMQHNKAVVPSFNKIHELDNLMVILKKSVQVMVDIAGKPCFDINEECVLMDNLIIFQNNTYKLNELINAITAQKEEFNLTAEYFALLQKQAGGLLLMAQAITAFLSSCSK